jgi:hypothetical protein
MTTYDSVMSFLNGASVFPFFLIAGAAYSPELFEVASGSKSSLSIAGVVGLLFVGGEVLSPAGLKSATETAISSRAEFPANIES